MQKGVPENRQLSQVGICVLRRDCDALCAWRPCGVLGTDGADPRNPPLVRNGALYMHENGA